MSGILEVPEKERLRDEFSAPPFLGKRQSEGIVKAINRLTISQYVLLAVLILHALIVKELVK